jgi:protein-L-isoaspartate(D-aspartate) O-methyltransferase
MIELSRRTLLAGAAATAAWPLIPSASFAGPVAGGTWNREVFLDVMAKSDRPTEISEASFRAIQARKPMMMKRIEQYLKEKLGSADPAVLAAFNDLPREYYHYLYDQKKTSASEAYDEQAKPWVIGYGSVLSDYLGQAYMTQVAKPQPGETSLEIGTGSGFQSSVLSRIVGKAYSIEIIEPVGKAVAKIFKPLGLDNIESRVGDGYFGWPEVAGGFDIIIVTCTAQYVPKTFFEQMKPGARLLIPIGQPFKRGHILYVYTKDADGKIHSRRDIGMYFIPFKGQMEKTPAPAGSPG